MTQLPSQLRLADTGEAADLAAFLVRLLRWDKSAVVRLQVAGRALAVFGQPPFGGVLAVRTCALADPCECDATVSAGQFLDAVDESAATATVPPGVTGPSWAGVLPPRRGWRRIAELDAEQLREAAAGVIAEFRARTEALDPEKRTRGELDALAAQVWSRSLGETELPLRAVHAAHALGFLRPVRVSAGGGGAAPADGPGLFTSGPWLRLGTAYGSVVVRRASGLGLVVSPV
ncbi:hypothetical protein ACFOSC_19230 [Streptantibioticus rubrisoli]|uniref:Uncharacterized protein n=1 Tax=Streptantibioticus rubrisoli TaxID=1387313 RepID=A0ABT1PJA4_9ACTN|nr:hypothetical protein [Streptantibioticus rubrisoli]MCQ4045434.1 hypothetical protein [Streptantibioticus rubrisoli]